MGGDILKGLAIGHMLTSDGGAAAAGAAAAAERARAEIEITKHRIATADWRRRAVILAANVNARKMSEDALLQALQQENANHPLASREAFEELYTATRSNERVKVNADFNAYADEIARQIPTAAEAQKAEEQQARVDAVQAMTADQFSAYLAKMQSDFSMGLIKEIPAYIHEEVDRRAGREPAPPKLSQHELMVAELQAMTEEQFAAKLRNLKEALSMGTIREIPSYVRAEMDRRQAEKVAQPAPK